MALGKAGAGVQFEMEIWSKFEPWDSRAITLSSVGVLCTSLSIAICTCLWVSQGKTNRKKFRRIVIPGGRHVGIAGGATLT